MGAADGGEKFSAGSFVGFCFGVVKFDPEDGEKDGTFMIMAVGGSFKDCGDSSIGFIVSF